MAEAAFDPHLALRARERAAAALLAVLAVALVALCTVVRVSGAVMAPGELIVSSEVKKIQHPTGGVVTRIAVHDGSRVRQGDLLIGLDPAVARADAAIVGESVEQLLARQARLEAERDGRPSLVFPPGLASRNDPGARAAMDDERRNFVLRAVARAEEKAQLAERQAQLRQEIAGDRAQIAAKQEQARLLDQELVGIQKLYDRQLVPLARLNDLKRSLAQSKGDVGALQATIAETLGRIAELQTQILQVDETVRADAGGQLADVQNRLADLEQRDAAAEQDLKRIDLFAPQTGVVDKLAVHTLGGVVAAGETIMEIVPVGDQLIVRASARPNDIDQVRTGQKASCRISAFNPRTTPQVGAVVQRVSADLETNEKTGASYYVVDLSIPPAQLQRLGSLKPKAGMPVQCYIQTRARSLMAYLLRPLQDQLSRAFREP